MAASMNPRVFEMEESEFTRKRLKRNNEEADCGDEMSGCNWKPVLDDAYLSEMKSVNVYVTEILHKTAASQIIQYLCSLYALPTLQHLKRIRAPSKSGGNLEVIIVLASDVSGQCGGESEVATKALFDENENHSSLNCLGCTARLVSVPARSPLTRRQYEQAKTMWPTLFHEDKWISSALNGTLFIAEEQETMDEHMRRAISAARQAVATKQRAIGCVIVDPSLRKVLAVCHDQSREHPLKHAVMVGIDLVAASQGGGAWNKPDVGCSSAQMTLQKIITAPYLCTGYDLYVTREPCIMCSMGLVHSRIGRVFYGCVNKASGALGSVYKQRSHDTCENACDLGMAAVEFKGVQYNEVVRSLSTPCPGLYCGRTLLLDGNWSTCGACPRGHRPNASSACSPCADEPSFHDWLYLSFMALLPLVLHWFCIDVVAKRRSFTFGVIVLHLAAVFETSASALLAVLLANPCCTFAMDSCRVQQLSDWYTMFHNPNPNYEHTLHCTQEAVYPLYTIVLVYYSFCLAFLLLVRPLLASKCLPVRGKASVYAAMYFLPVLALLHATCAGLLYYSFPYITVIGSVVSIAAHFAFQLDQSMKSLVLTTIVDLRNLVILLGHWALHAYGIVAIAELRNLPFHWGLLALVPLPAAFYVLTARFTDPNKFRSE